MEIRKKEKEGGIAMPISEVMNQEDSNLLAECIKEAMKVEFLNTSEEIKLWAYSLYNAKIWGKSVK
ncbi:hypothetical protein F3B77_11825 [Bacteroides ovatus]|uniref:Uncharacterized protein n=1 Tax=Bacteroides ovatus TaxID=28116 RepID=A0A5M5FAB6_BACOV|nr:hypothetical protein [Bacteroides ovatus]KAA2459162.1 hypothetical protein F2X73_15765 [Alistipes onderdonkii]KAB4949532.1 hypothetical protein GAG64_26460 [Bacteroides thetaiotaomicron]KAA4070634.1 hypothetical protein F3D37_09165 [Bacteroides ovatus]KAA4078673.1 hypothetical protein F3D38_10205 [Bacteroides ovatus]KAA4112539.1 hypothetical protein F3D35_13085 [Bacteroides ovatus]